MRLLCTRLPPVLEIYGVDESLPFRDLAPSILRQRLVIEGTRARPITAAEIRDYLVSLSHVCAMNVLIEPVTHRSERFGWAGWVHWETSGAHFYAWDEPFVFFSVDIYTCKAFDAQRAVEFTRSYFDADEVVAKEF
jgi:S-adenosylmethionine/arginine decarboxylase-like enzyme